ncbi:uncharacterized protein N7484_010251 [Penicillium longicatenatum]|nr:uncharacterized protein N7484_010251 [Penicillium longicatenatum]KAJ5636938.1 hypothetical protein N7484_010251 [Penicillium longicatenatum]
MELDMSWDLFNNVTIAKETNSDLKIFISIGGSTLAPETVVGKRET